MIHNKYFDVDLNEKQIEKEVKALNLDFIEIESNGFGIVTYMEYKGDNLEFEVSYDDDTASFRHNLDWVSEGKIYNFLPTRWTMNINSTEDYIKILKRRVKKYLKY
jgi:hypothetical protein